MRKYIATTCALLLSPMLQAVEMPNIGNALKEVQPPKDIKRPQKPLPEISQDDNATVPKEVSGGKKIFIRRYSISGAKHMDNSKLKAIVKPYEEKELSFAEMKKVANLITKAYREEGYFVARAYIPKQNILTKRGSLKINVIEGEYGEFHLENSSLVDDSILQANLDAIKNGNIVSSDSIQRGMLIINDTPGAIVTRADVTPGKRLGTSDFIMETNATKRFSGYLIADNYGSIYTGKYRAMGGIEVNSPFGIGDKIYGYALTTNNAGLLNGQIGYDFPILPNGTRGDISYSKTTYSLGEDYSALDATGYADSLKGRISYPIIRSLETNLDSYLALSYNKLVDKIATVSEENSRNTRVAVLGVNYSNSMDFFGRNSNNQASLYLTAGNLRFKEETDRLADEVGANTQGNFSKINIELSKGISIADKTIWQNSLQLQYAFGKKNLDGSQQLSISGINGVRFYPDSEESADNGYIFSTELKYALPTFMGISSQVSLFYDAGRAYMSDNVVGYNPRILQDAGLGYYGMIDSFFIDAQLAKKVGGEPVTSQSDYSTRFLLQGGYFF